MNRFLVFSFITGTPVCDDRGGWDHFDTSVDTEDDALSFLFKKYHQSGIGDDVQFQIVDIHQLNPIKSGKLSDQFPNIDK